MIAANLPALQIVVPLISAPLCALIPNGRVAWLVTTVIAWLTLIMAAALLSQVSTGVPLSYEMGGWAAPWGIEYHIDRLSALMLVLVAGIGGGLIAYRDEVLTMFSLEEKALLGRYLREGGFLFIEGNNRFWVLRRDCAAVGFDDLPANG